MTATVATVKRLLASDRLSFLITAAVVFCATSSSDAAVVLSNGNYTWLLAVMSPFFFVFYDDKKLMYLGTSKKDYFLGCMVSYGLLALLVSAVNTAIWLLIDPLNHTQTVVNLMGICGWTQNGAVMAFLQQMLFLFLVMTALHLLLSIQPYWYGWLTDAVLVVVLCVFTPIAPLRQLLSGFFSLVMFNRNAPAHIGLCLLLSAALSAAGLAVLKRKTL